MKIKFNVAWFALIISLFIIFTLRQSFVHPPRIDTSHSFQTDRAFERLERLLGDETPHPVDSEANNVVLERLVSEIENLGFIPIVNDDFHCGTRPSLLLCARVKNVMFWIGDAGPNAIMVASHYDSVPTGPGAADDASGVAASLEIAHVLNERDLKRPVLVMITDGEEVGLVGASYFVQNNPIANMVSVVVSMEARGNSGPVALIETSAPNGRDLSVLKTGLKKPIASSLAADVYAAMPNATDVTEYLKLGLDAGNFALGGDAAFYHTPKDNLARLNKRSFFHMGATALGSVEALLETPGDEAEKQWMYIDLFGLFVIKLPQFFALPVIGLGGLLALTLFYKNGKGGAIKALAFPPLALFLGLAFAVGLTFLIGAIRPETHYAAAHPWALRGAQNIAALLGGLLALLLLKRSVPQTRLVMAGWIWFALLGLGATLAFSGSAILFTPSLGLVLLAGLLFKGNSRLSYLLLFSAAVLFTLMGIVTSALGEIMLFPEYASPFALFIILSFVLLAPIFLKENTERSQSNKSLVFTVLGTTTVFALAALLLPAYSPNAPRGLSITHSQDEAGNAFWSARTRDPLPTDMTKIAGFQKGQLEGFRGSRYIAPAPNFDSTGIAMRIVKDEINDSERQMSIVIEAPNVDFIDITLSGEDMNLDSLQLNEFIANDAPPKRIRCTGMSCRELELTLTLNEAAQDMNLELTGYLYGLGPESKDLLDARPNWALPQHRGDLRVIKTKVAVD